jgi:hypothetical protein
MLRRLKRLIAQHTLNITGPVPCEEAFRSEQLPLNQQPSEHPMFSFSLRLQIAVVLKVL